LVVVMSVVFREAHRDLDCSRSHHELDRVDSGQLEQANAIAYDLCHPHGVDLSKSVSHSSDLTCAKRTWRTSAITVWVGTSVIVPIAI
jgi:hypothetical protein